MPSIALGTTVQISGTKEAITAAGNIRRAPQRALRAAAVARSDQTVARFRQELLGEYHSPWATGQIARSVRAKVNNTNTGVSVTFTANSGARDHIQYITAVVGGGFDKFPVRPFTIKPIHYKYLYIRFPGRARAFIQNKDTGKIEGSRSGRIRAKKVLWGSKSGGFHRDVITEVAQSEGQIFVQDVIEAFKASLASIPYNPRKARNFTQDPVTGRLGGSTKG